jgi:multidrug resistance efflux pump
MAIWRELGVWLTAASDSAVDAPDQDKPNLHRRALSFAALAISPILGVGAKPAMASDTRPSESKMQIAVPKDCFVKKITYASGATVKANDLIAILDSDDEESTLERITLATAFVSLQQDAISDEQVQIRRQVIQSTVDVAKAYLDYARLRLDFINSQIDFAGYAEGNEQSNRAARQQSAAAVIRAESEWRRTQSALALFDFNTRQAKQKIELIQAELPKQIQKTRDRIKDRLNMRSPRHGTISYLCYEGAFLSKGAILAEVS